VAAATTTRLADALVMRSADRCRGWGDVVTFAASTTTSPGGLVDKGAKGKHARVVPLIAEVRELVQNRIDALEGKPDARLFTGQRGGRITTAVLRDATHWDEVVSELGHEHLRRHSLRHTGLTWMADAGVPVHVLRKIAGHATQRYLHPDRRKVIEAGNSLSAHLRAPRSPNGPQTAAP
jgi:integrase